FRIRCMPMGIQVRHGLPIGGTIPPLWPIPVLLRFVKERPQGDAPLCLKSAPCVVLVFVVVLMTGLAPGIPQLPRPGHPGAMEGHPHVAPDRAIICRDAPERCF